MKKTSLLICLGGFGLCLVAILLKHDSSPKVPDKSTPPLSLTEPAIPPAETDAGVVVESRPAETDDTAHMLENIQTALLSDYSSNHIKAFDELLPALVKMDPYAAAAFAESPDAGNWRSEAMRVVAQNWAKTNPNDAVNWAARITDPAERDAAISHVCLQSSEKDPSWAVQTLEQYGVGDYQSAMMENAVQHWAKQDLSAALAWAGGRPPGEERDKLFARIAFAQSQVAPADAAWTVVKEIPSGPVQNEAALTVLNQWGTKDLPGALSWANNFPAGDLFDRAQTQLEGINLYQSNTN